MAINYVSRKFSLIFLIYILFGGIAFAMDTAPEGGQSDLDSLVIKFCDGAEAMSQKHADLVAWKQSQLMKRQLGQKVMAIVAIGAGAYALYRSPDLLLAAYDYCLGCSESVPCDELPRQLIRNIPVFGTLGALSIVPKGWILMIFNSIDKQCKKFVDTHFWAQLSQEEQELQKHATDLEGALKDMKISEHDSKRIVNAACAIGHVGILRVLKDELACSASALEEIEEDRCAICRSAWDEWDGYKGPVIKLNCDHVFHAECIKDIVSCCPLCRKNIDSRAKLFTHNS